MKNTNYTVEQLQGMNSTELRKAAQELGIKNVKTFKKVDLLTEAVSQLPKEKSPYDVAVGNVEVSEMTGGAVEVGGKVIDLTDSDITFEEFMSIMNSTNISKSEKFRMLHKQGKGLRVADIARVFGSHYSYVFGVIDRQRQKDRKNGQ